MSTNDGKSSRAIERDVERTRARLSGKLEALRDRMSPQQVVEDLMDYARGGEMMGAISQSVKANPMPLLLIGAGIGWLMMTGQARGDDSKRSALSSRDGKMPGHGSGRLRGGGDGRHEARMRSQGMHPYGVGPQGIDYERDHERGREHETRQSGPGMATRASEAASSAAGSIGETASSAAHSIGDAASSAWHGMTHAASDAASAVRGAAGSAREDTARYAAGFGERSRGAGSGAFDAMQGQPLVLAAIGLAVGAAIGAALPSTESEDEWFGERSDQLKKDAGQLGQEGLDKAKAVAERAYGSAEEEARRQGMDGNGNARHMSNEETAREGMRHEAEKHVGPIRH